MAREPANDALSAWLDGELGDAERAEIDAMLASDPALRDELAEIEAVSTMLREHGPVRAPPGFHARLMARVEAEPAPGGWWAWLRRPFGLPIEGLAVAAVALLVLLVALPVTLTTGLVTSYESGRDVSTAPSSWDRAAPSAPEPSPAAAGSDAAAPTDDAVADVDVGDAEEPRVGDETRASARPSKEAVAAPPIAQTVAGTADEPSAAPASKSAAKPELHGALGYEVRTGNLEATSRLQAIAGKYRGTVEDASGRKIAPSALKDGEAHTYVVRVPAESLAEFGDALRSLGTVREVRDDKLHAGPMIPVTVTLWLDAPQAPYRSSPDQEYAEPTKDGR